MCRSILNTQRRLFGERNCDYPSSYSNVTCLTCKGYGIVYERVGSNGKSEPLANPETCSECRGVGRLIKRG